MTARGEALRIARKVADEYGRQSGDDLNPDLLVEALGMAGVLNTEEVAHAVIADGYVLAADRNEALMWEARARLVSSFPAKVFEPGLVALCRARRVDAT